MDKNKTILIVDDIEINRMLLAEIFNDDYNIVEACNGAEAIEIMNGQEFSALLMDVIMPEVNGIGVLEEMNRSGKIEKIPVFLITAADSEEMLLNGYNLGAIDIIRKPFISQFLKCRVNNVVELYEHRNELERIVAAQVKKLSEMNQSIVETLATALEFRDGDSGEHVKRMCARTRTIITKVSNTYSEYHLPSKEIEKIVLSSVLHDMGKISIPDAILNKPGRLTPEEFEIIKQHTVKGCEILQSVPDIMNNEIYEYCYDICRHHHERWDGKGYPDGLKGDEITIWSQVVALADVYDALTSDRVYKKAFSKETAVNMICNGECGTFNPKLLAVFKELQDVL